MDFYKNQLVILKNLVESFQQSKAYSKPSQSIKYRLEKLSEKIDYVIDQKGKFVPSTHKIYKFLEEEKKLLKIASDGIIKKEESEKEDSEKIRIPYELLDPPAKQKPSVSHFFKNSSRNLFSHLPNEIQIPPVGHYHPKKSSKNYLVSKFNSVKRDVDKNWLIIRDYLSKYPGNQTNYKNCIYLKRSKI